MVCLSISHLIFGMLQHEFARGAEKVWQRCWSPRQSGSILQSATIYGTEVAQEDWNHSRRYQTGQYFGKA